MKFKHLLMLSACLVVPGYAADAAKTPDAAPAAKADDAKTADAAAAKPAKAKKSMKKHGHHPHKYHHKKHEPVLCEAVKPVSGTPEGYIRVTDNTFIGIHGYANAQMNYDSAPFAGDYVSPAALAWTGLNDTAAPAAINSPSKSNVVSAHAKQTRISFSALTTGTRFGDVKAYIEADFYGTQRDATAATGLAYTLSDPTVAGNHAVRMRKAYGEVGGFLLGQTTPLFIEVQQADTVDFGGQHDTFRLMQVRYTWKANDMFKWAFAVERPSSDYIEYSSTAANIGAGTSVTSVNPVGAGQGNVDHKLPALSTKAVYTFGDGHEIGLRGLLRQIALKDQTITAGASFKKTGWGVGADLKIMTMNKGFISAAISHGSAIGHYIAEMDGQSVVWDKNPARTRLDAQKQTYWGVGYNQPLNDEWAVGLGYSTSFTSKASGFETGMNVNGVPARAVNLTNARRIQTKSADKLFGNIMWAPVKNVDIGLEYMHAIRKGMTDSTVTRSLKGTARRVILAAKYSF